MPKCESLWHIKEMFLKHVGVSFGKYFNARCSPSPFREFRTKLSPTSKRKNRHFHQKKTRKCTQAHKTDKTLSDTPLQFHNLSQNRKAIFSIFITERKKN